MNSPRSSSRDPVLPLRTSVGLQRFMAACVAASCSAAGMFLPHSSSLVSTLAPAWSSLCWLPLSPVELGGCERSYITALHRAISLSLCSHQWGNEKRRKRERGKEREKGEVGATKAKRKEQRGEEEGRGGHRVVLFVRRRMNEIFISDAEEMRLLSCIFSLWFYHSFTSSYSSSVSIPPPPSLL